ncbi:MAG: CPBP family intramembrane metalloprotease [Lachnospiraceae bacterium]|nr:CPBP family intramembrane metalloprotease [Lachnospiraceae bacterium]
MTTKKANWLFLTIILVHIGVVVLLNFAWERISINIIMNFFLSEMILMVPTLLFLLISEQKSHQTRPPVYGAYGMEPAAPVIPRPFEAAAFHKIKISTLLMIVLCTFLIMPLVVVLNALSMFFTDNAMAALQGDIVDTPFVVMLFMIGIMGPFCEEFVFRGVIYRSYRRRDEDENNERYKNGRSGGIRAILLSAFLFGLMHMNYNQMIYAFAMGILLAFLVEAAGSLWASVFCHMFFNSIEVVLMYVSSSILSSAYGRAASEAAAELTTQELLAALSVYLIIAAVTTPIAVCVVVLIAKNEGRQDAVAALFAKSQKHLLSIPLIVAMVLCFGYMSLEFFL